MCIPNQAAQVCTTFISILSINLEFNYFQVELNIISNITCYENYKTLDIQIRKDMICTYLGPLGTENVCSGDSGSPLMVNRKGRLVHVGLTSFTLADCTSPFPAVYSRTAFFLDWIKAALTYVQ